VSPFEFYYLSISDSQDKEERLSSLSTMPLIGKMKLEKMRKLKSKYQQNCNKNL
jgi:hypothetical protein